MIGSREPYRSKIKAAVQEVDLVTFHQIRNRFRKEFDIELSLGRAQMKEMNQHNYVNCPTIMFYVLPI